MFRLAQGSIILLIAVFILATCIDPYTPELKGYQSLLVVDGLLTNENSSCTVKLTRTIQDQVAKPEKVKGAELYLTDDKGATAALREVSQGVYKTDSTVFRGEAGRGYILHINTPDGKYYQSETCLMEPVPDIDNLHYEKDQKLINNGTENATGITIYLDSKQGSNDFFRWDFSETWKFRVPFPQRFEFVNESLIVPITKIKQTCWKIRNSDEIIISQAPASGQLKQQPVFFIASDKSDRLLSQYSILVRQYSISQKEFDFWTNLQKVNESGSDIFSSQPFSVISNIFNVDNPSEMVLGYFKVSAVAQKRIDITFNELLKYKLPVYQYPCRIWAMAPEDYVHPGSMATPPTWQEIYDGFCTSSDYIFVEPWFGALGLLRKLVFTRPECGNCEKTGTSVEPDFWIDQE